MLAGGLAVVASPLEEEGEGAGPGGEAVVALAAPEGAAATGFSTDALSVPSDVPFTLAFENADPGVPHNVVIYDGPDAEAPQLFRGELVTGPGTVDYAVEPVVEGEFFFNCEVHPTTMTGTMTAAPGGGEGGGGEGGGVTVVAANISKPLRFVRLKGFDEALLCRDFLGGCACEGTTCMDARRCTCCREMRVCAEQSEQQGTQRTHHHKRH